MAFEDKRLQHFTARQLRGRFMRGTAVAFVLLVSTFFSHQAALWLWGGRVFVGVWLTLFWYQMLREVRRRRDNITA